MADFIELISTEGIEDGTMRQVDLEGHEFLVTRAAGEFYVTDARCAHLGGRSARRP